MPRPSDACLPDRPTVVEVRRRSDQGITRPFYCRADDDQWYWVKGKDAGRHSLCAEWLAGCLARGFGLPVPEFRQLVVPDELVRDSAMADIDDLGVGIAFGSCDARNTRDLQVGDVRRISQEVRGRILFFDWWVQNTDRTLGAEGGNPNLRWSDADEKLWVIDHNLTFQADFVLPTFFARHVFAADRGGLGGRQLMDMAAQAADIMERVPDLVATIPEPWLFLDAALTQASGFAEVATGILKGKACSLGPDWGLGR